MKISRERILQLDIWGFVKRCDFFREYAPKLYLYDNAHVAAARKLKELRNIEEAAAAGLEEKEAVKAKEAVKESAAYKRIYNEWIEACLEYERIEWVVFEVAKRAGVYLGRNEWDLSESVRLNYSGWSLGVLFVKQYGVTLVKDYIKIIEGAYNGQLQQAVSDVLEVKKWQHMRRRMFDAGADEMELRRLENTDFPVAYLITQGEVYGELQQGARDWGEVVEQLATLEHYRSLVQSPFTPKKVAKIQSLKSEIEEFYEAGRFANFESRKAAAEWFCSVKEIENVESVKTQLSNLGVVFDKKKQGKKE